MTDSYKTVSGSRATLIYYLAQSISFSLRSKRRCPTNRVLRPEPTLLLTWPTPIGLFFSLKKVPSNDKSSSPRATAISCFAQSNFIFPFAQKGTAQRKAFSVQSHSHFWICPIPFYFGFVLKRMRPTKSVPCPKPHRFLAWPNRIGFCFF